MKISDNDFLQKIWEFQLRKVSRAVLQKYANGGFSVTRADDYSYLYSTSIHTINRGEITDKIGKQQAYKRIRNLININQLSWANFKITFCIDTQQSRNVFTKARDFWLKNGVPTGFCEIKKGIRTVEIDNYELLLDECHKALVNEFGTLNLQLIKPKKEKP